MRFMAVEQDDPLGGSIYHSPRQETGQAGHVSSEHAAVVAHPTVTEVLAGCGQAEDALEKHTLALIIRVYAKTYNTALSLH